MKTNEDDRELEEISETECCQVCGSDLEVRDHQLYCPKCCTFGHGEADEQ